MFGLMVQAQNINLLKKANNCDVNFARSLSDELTASAKSNYVYLATKESKYLKLVTFVYIKQGISDEEKKSIEAYLARYTGKYELQQENCLCVHFKVNEVAGGKEFLFDNMKGKFIDLFPFYQKNIEPTATADNTSKVIYSVRKATEGYWYNLAKSNVNDDIWYLKNMSSRLN